MDGRRFDAFTRALATAASRRQLLRALVGSSAASMLTILGAGQAVHGNAPVPRTARLMQTKAAQAIQQIEYFALGDSIASGHGLMDDGSACRRSALSYPYKVLVALESKYSIKFVRHLACSGATVLKPGQKPSDPRQWDDKEWFATQVDAAVQKLQSVPRDRPVLVSVTAGIDDFQWLSWNIVPHLVEPEFLFRQWLDGLIGQVTNELRKQLVRLLNPFPNVAIVITQYHNPVNKQSIFFSTAVTGGETCETAINRPLGDPLACYKRTEVAIHALNDALEQQVRGKLLPQQQQRVWVTPNLHEAFHQNGGHEAPGALGTLEGPGICGAMPPGTSQTWIQYPGDPESNSLVFLAGLPRPISFGISLKGDCFHPNERGAQAYSNAVIEGAIPLLESLRAFLNSDQPTPTSPSIIEPTCSEQGANCSGDADCCAGVCTNGTCGPSSSATSGPSSPSGICAVGQRCGGTENTECLDAACCWCAVTTEGEQLCLRPLMNCDDVCTTSSDCDPAEFCIPNFPGMTCSSNSTGVCALPCDSNGQPQPQMTSTVIGPACGDQGASCSSDSDCCGGGCVGGICQAPPTQVISPPQVTVPQTPPAQVSPSNGCIVGQPCNQAETQGCQDAACCDCEMTTEGDAICLHPVLGNARACGSTSDCGRNEVCLAGTNGNVCAHRCITTTATPLATPVPVNCADQGESCQLPSQYLGTWRGTGASTDPAQLSEVEVTLTGRSIGAVVGTTSYPAAGCEGQLTLTAVNPYSVEVTEQITAGTGECAGGPATLSLSPEGFLVFQWEGMSGSPTMGLVKT